MKIVIYGAKSIALGVCLAIRELYGDFEVDGFLVADRQGNPDTLAGLPVFGLGQYPSRDVCVLIGTPEDIQDEIVGILEKTGFHNHVCIDSKEESLLMTKYYKKNGAFKLLKSL